MNDWLAFKVKGRMTAAPSLARVPDPRGAKPATTSTEAISVEKPERRDWAFFFLLVFTVVVFLRPQDAIPGLHYLHLAELSAISALVALIGGRLGRNLPVTRVNPELIGVVALGGLILVTAPFSIWFSGAIGVFTEYYGKIIVIYLLMTNVLTSPRRIERLTWVLVLPSGYLAFRAVLDFARGVQLTESGGRLHGAVGGIFGNPNDLALNMVALLPLAAFLALREGSALRRGIAGACALFMFGAVIASHSRGGALGLAAMAGVFGLFLLRRRPGLVFGVAITLALAAPMAPASYWHRLASITDESQDDTGSRETRRTLLRESYQAFLENPLTGVGAGQFKNWNPAGRQQPWHESHDVLLQVAAELGIGGVLIMSYLILRGAMSVGETRRLLRRTRAYSNRRRTAGQTKRGGGPPVQPVAPDDAAFFDVHSASMAAALAGWFVCALFGSVAYNWTFYYLLALAAAPRDILQARQFGALTTRRRRRVEVPAQLEVARA